MQEQGSRYRWRRARRSEREEVNVRQGALPPELLTGLLLAALLILLIGIARELPNPPPPSPPDIFTSVAYSTLVRQVQAGQVVAVNIQGNELDGLLARSLTQRIDHGFPPPSMAAPTNTADIETATVASFVDCGPSVSASCFDEDDAPLFPRERIVYTLFPQQDAAFLLPLLMSRHVVVNIVPTMPHPAWVVVLWKTLPFYIFALLLVYLELEA